MDGIYSINVIKQNIEEILLSEIYNRILEKLLIHLKIVFKWG